MASRWQKTLSTAASLSGLIGGAYDLFTGHPRPQKSGTVRLQGLHASVDIITDHHGIPHIYAQNTDDLYFAQGYIHAQERLWQMEVNRRLGAGRLSELFGNATLETDRFCRRIGMRRAAIKHLEQISEQARHHLEAYARGVNAFITTNPDKLSAELTLLHCQPEPWQPVDTIQWSKVQSWGLDGNWETEMIRARLVAKLGAERAARLEPGYDPHQPLIVPPGVAYEGLNQGLLEQYANIKDLSGFGLMGGSNNWVVDGSMTQSGAPMLCNDPHMRQSLPSIWFECHLLAGDMNVIGASFPGAPGIIIGHSQHIAWGTTNAVSDVQDLYIEKFNPQQPYQYEFQGQWEDAQVIREEIKVKGQAQPVIEEVRITRHGPIITALPQSNHEKAVDVPLALRWISLEQGKIAEAVYKLNTATNWHEFLTALHDWDAPAQNFVYADTQGNIGYMMAGAIPIRAQGLALLPSPGWTGEYEWTGMVPFTELPQTYNPQQHFIVTANNRVVDDSYPYYISHEWSNGYRAQRIQDLLTSKEQLTLDDMATIQTDQYALPARTILPYILQVTADTPLKRAAQEILSTWDLMLTPDSIGALLYSTCVRKLERLVLDALIGDDEALVQRYQGLGADAILSELNGYLGRSRPLIIRLLQEHDDRWFANSAIPNGPTSWDSALASALEATIDELSNHLGKNILRWQYGTLHKITYSHALGSIKPLANIFNRGPFPIGGDSDTVNVSHSIPNKAEEVVVVAAYRQIIDLQQLSNSRSIHAPGQSGHPASQHYADFIPLWRANQYHPMLFERAEIEAASEATLHLMP